MQLTDWLTAFVWVCYFAVAIMFGIATKRLQKKNKAFNKNMTESRRLQLEADELFEQGQREKALMKLNAAHAALERARELI